MKNRMTLFAALFIAALFSQFASATFIGDSLNATYNNAFGSVFDNTTTVGAGVDFSGSVSIHNCTLDLTEDSFTLTVSKPFSAGNFTAIFTSLEITGIDYGIANVSFDTANSSAFSSGTPSIDFSNPGLISLSSSSSFASANTPSSALSHSFTWNVEFQSVPEPASLALLTLGLAGLGLSRRKKA